MSVELSFRDVSYPGFFEGFSCKIPAGSSALIITSQEAESSLLTRLITGMSYPSHGAVFWGSQEISRLVPKHLNQLRQQIGVVPANGGLVSNLKVWENITLPLLYHHGGVTPAQEEAAHAYLATLGYSGNLLALPAHLSLHEKRIIAIVRTLLTCPRIIVYSGCFEGESSAYSKQFSQLATEFHANRDDRISLYLASSSDMAVDLNVDHVIQLHEPHEPAETERGRDDT